VNYPARATDPPVCHTPNSLATTRRPYVQQTRGLTITPMRVLKGGTRALRDLLPHPKGRVTPSAEPIMGFYFALSHPSRVALQSYDAEGDDDLKSPHPVAVDGTNAIVSSHPRPWPSTVDHACIVTPHRGRMMRKRAKRREHCHTRAWGSLQVGESNIGCHTHPRQRSAFSLLPHLVRVVAHLDKSVTRTLLPHPLLEFPLTPYQTLGGRTSGLGLRFARP
jgi:hypothetical protein